MRWLALPLALAACGAHSADTYELQTMRQSNIVPKSSPAQFATTFERYCLDHRGTADALVARLRSAGFVEVPGNRRLRRFVVDDRRPAVLWRAGRDRFECGVGAISRTGQTQRVRDVMDDLGARPIAPPPNAEEAWMLDGTTIFSGRGLSLDGATRYSLMLMRPQAATSKTRTIG